MQPIRPIVHSLTELPRPAEEMTLRDAIEWTKTIVRQAPPVPTGSERQMMDGAFVQLMKAISEREGVGIGFLAGFVHEIATTEIQLLETAAREAEAVI
jgi:hypothetical protein